MAKIPGFCGGAYESRSTIADAQRCINLYPEQSTEKNSLVLIGTPGRSLLATMTDYPIRKFCLTRGRLFVISGSTLYELDLNFTATTRGTIAGYGNCSISSNGTELYITSGSYNYLYTLATNTLTQLSVGGTKQGVFWEGRYVSINADSQTIYWSGLYDGSSWDSLSFVSSEGSPDYAKKLVVDHREVIVFGEESIESFSLVANADCPLYPNRAAHSNMGIDAVESVIVLDNRIFFIGGNSDGRGIGYAIEGYRPQRITTHAIESAWAKYSTIEDAVAYGYIDEGHSFWVINFPSANKTWAYDAATGLWHERGFWNTASAQWEADRAICHVFAFGKHIIGDRENGNLYDQDLDIYDDNSSPIRRLRTVPHIHSENRRIYTSMLEVHAEMGMGLNSGQGEDPQMMLRISDDGGKTFGNEMWASLGRQGAYSNRAQWRRLGAGIDRVFEISCTEPTKQVWIDGYIT